MFFFFLRNTYGTLSHILQVYFYNFTNAEKFFSGEEEKPYLQEVGPYTYR